MPAVPHVSTSIRHDLSSLFLAILPWPILILTGSFSTAVLPSHNGHSITAFLDLEGQFWQRLARSNLHIYPQNKYQYNLTCTVCLRSFYVARNLERNDLPFPILRYGTDPSQLPCLSIELRHVRKDSNLLVSTTASCISFYCFYSWNDDQS